MATSKPTSSSTTTKKAAPPTAKKAASSTKKAASASTAKTAKKPTKTKLINTGISPDERSQMIAEAAYYRAEQRGFNPEGQVEDWLQAEAMIDEMLSHSAGARSSQRH